jgi:hypothetical protein
LQDLVSLDDDQDRPKVPCYWVIALADQTSIAYRLVDGKYCVVFPLERRIQAVRHRLRIPPFEEVEINPAQNLRVRDSQPDA